MSTRAIVFEGTQGVTPAQGTTHDSTLITDRHSDDRPVTPPTTREEPSPPGIVGFTGFAVGLRRRVKFTTEEARSYKTKGSELQGRETSLG